LIITPVKAITAAISGTITFQSSPLSAATRAAAISMP
jgi:hypothetical protein